MEAAEVKLDNVGKRYGEQWVVRGVDLHIQRGEFFTFLGPSGCGKTTLLRMIAGFVQPDEGSVRLDGQVVNQVPPWQRNVGLVFQNYALWPHLSVFENVAFGLRQRKIPRDEINRRVLAVLAQVELTGTEARRPSQLSGGQQQRVALARTLVIQPRVLLLDEPLSNLDAKLRVEMRLELLKLQRDLGLTTIYVTHDQEEALALSTTIAVIEHGQVIQQGAPRQIYERPANGFVAGFIGQSNLIAATVERVQGQSVIACVDGVEGNVNLSLTLPSMAVKPGPGIAVLLCIRPEAIEVGDSSADLVLENRIPAKVIASAYQGAFVEYEASALNTTFRARVTNPKSKKLYQRNDAVTLGFAAADVVLIRREP
ncbi:MAG: ABC transporter ATP-binding protein [Deltaproteobacteria bacterium]|nr:ABC transporter ATP-binding protein [Deltaproteobacteria bacterium]